MSSPEIPNAILVDTPQKLNLLFRQLEDHPCIAIDTESNSMYAYQERVCLLQVSIPGADYLIDPFETLDLAPLGKLLADPSVQKVFHAVEYDLLCLQRDYGWEMTNIFDTMLAARALGIKRVGLGNLLADEFDIHLEKKYQRADWGIRPLPQGQLRYAQFDTHYLIELKNRLTAKLNDAGLWEEFTEEVQRLINVCQRAAEKPPEDESLRFWRVSGSRYLNGRQAAVLKELFDYREKVANRLDRPTFKIIGDKTLLAIATDQPRNFEQLSYIKGMSERQINRHGRKLMKAIKRGITAPKQYPLTTPMPDESIRNRYDALQSWRKQRAIDRGVESDVIVSKDVLWNLARNNPATEADLETIQDLGPYRRKKYGAELIALLAEQ